MRLVDAILSGNLVEARELFAARINQIFEEKLHNLKLRTVAEDYDPDLFLPEANIMRMGRTKLIRLRIRKGKVQRRKKF